MHPKQKKIIEVSIELFAKKGFHATSVQEIVDRANVAKGSFYNYFESKEDLILSIHDYYYGIIMEKISSAKEKDDPKTALRNQLKIFLQFILENKPLIIMLLRDQVPLGKDVESLIITTKQQSFEWTKENIKEIYGKPIEPYENDASVLFEGILKSYFNWLVVDEDSVDVDYLPQFLVEMLDHICIKLIEQKPKKVIKHLPNVFNAEALLLNRIKQMVQSIVIEDKEKALEAVQVLESELNRHRPQKIVIESMIMHLNKYDALKNEIKQLEKMLDLRE